MPEPPCRCTIMQASRAARSGNFSPAARQAARSSPRRERCQGRSHSDPASSSQLAEQKRASSPPPAAPGAAGRGRRHWEQAAASAAGSGDASSGCSLQTTAPCWISCAATRPRPYPGSCTRDMLALASDSCSASVLRLALAPQVRRSAHADATAHMAGFDLFLGSQTIRPGNARRRRPAGRFKASEVRARLLQRRRAPTRPPFALPSCLLFASLHRIVTYRLQSLVASLPAPLEPKCDANSSSSCSGRAPSCKRAAGVEPGCCPW